MKKIFQSILILLTIVSFSSCLKDDTIIGPDSPNSAGAIIEFENPDFIVANTLTATVKRARYAVTVTKGASSQLHMRVNYSGTGKGAPNDVTVNLGIDAAELTLHNTQAARTTANAFNLIPATWYTMPTSVIIPKGETGVDFNISINTNNYVAGTLYALPLKITSASSGTLSGNFGVIIVNVLAP